MRKRLNPTLLTLLVALIAGTIVMVRLVMTAPTPTELYVRQYAREQGISFRAYPKSLITLLESNPETESFVLNYPFREEESINMSDLDCKDGVPLMLQWDSRWGYLTYGDDFAAVTGCGPMCLSMAGWYLTGDARFSPDRLFAFADENGYYSKGNGSKWTLISEGAPALGLTVMELPLVEQTILNYLKNGELIIAIMGEGDFTTSGHYILITDVQEGMLVIRDPNSIINSEKLWDYNVFASQVRNLWLIQANPLS